MKFVGAPRHGRVFHGLREIHVIVGLSHRRGGCAREGGRIGSMGGMGGMR
jgi:hypothetical protein